MASRGSASREGRAPSARCLKWRLGSRHWTSPRASTRCGSCGSCGPWPQPRWSQRAVRTRDRGVARRRRRSSRRTGRPLQLSSQPHARWSVRPLGSPTLTTVTRPSGGSNVVRRRPRRPPAPCGRSTTSPGYCAHAHATGSSRRPRCVPRQPAREGVRLGSRPPRARLAPLLRQLAAEEQSSQGRRAQNARHAFSNPPTRRHRGATPCVRPVQAHAASGGGWLADGPDQSQPRARARSPFLSPSLSQPHTRVLAPFLSRTHTHPSTHTHPHSHAHAPPPRVLPLAAPNAPRPPSQVPDCGSGGGRCPRALLVVRGALSHPLAAALAPAVQPRQRPVTKGGRDNGPGGVTSWQRSRVQRWHQGPTALGCMWRDVAACMCQHPLLCCRLRVRSHAPSHGGFASPQRLA